MRSKRKDGESTKKMGKMKFVGGMEESLWRSRFKKKTGRWTRERVRGASQSPSCLSYAEGRWRYLTAGPERYGVCVPSTLQTKGVLLRPWAWCWCGGAVRCGAVLTRRVVSRGRSAWEGTGGLALGIFMGLDWAARRGASGFGASLGLGWGAVWGRLASPVAACQ